MDIFLTKDMLEQLDCDQDTAELFGDCFPEGADLAKTVMPDFLDGGLILEVFHIAKAVSYQGQAVSSCGTSCVYFEYGEPHRDDGPAVYWLDGTIEWCQRGKVHNDDGPARIYPDGTKVYAIDGNKHNDNGPAVINANGTCEFWEHGELTGRANFIP